MSNTSKFQQLLFQAHNPREKLIHKFPGTEFACVYINARVYAIVDTLDICLVVDCEVGPSALRQNVIYEIYDDNLELGFNHLVSGIGKVKAVEYLCKLNDVIMGSGGFVDKPLSLSALGLAWLQPGNGTQNNEQDAAKESTNTAKESDTGTQSVDFIELINDLTPRSGLLSNPNRGYWISAADPHADKVKLTVGDLKNGFRVTYTQNINGHLTIHYTNPIEMMGHPGHCGSMAGCHREYPGSIMNQFPQPGGFGGHPFIPPNNPHLAAAMQMQQVNYPNNWNCLKALIAKIQEQSLKQFMSSVM